MRPRIAFTRTSPYREYRHSAFDPAHFLRWQLFETERIARTISHRRRDEQWSAYRLCQAFYSRGDIHGVSNRGKLEPLRRADAADDRRPTMDSDSNLDRRASLRCKLVIQTFDR